VSVTSAKRKWDKSSIIGQIRPLSTSIGVRNDVLLHCFV
jgi:hypothetical protein